MGQSKMSTKGKDALRSMLAYKQGKISIWLKEFSANSNWINSHLNELRAKYPDMYIAVRKKRVVMHEKNLAILKEKLMKEFGEIEDIAVEFISSKPVKLLF